MRLRWISLGLMVLALSGCGKTNPAAAAQHPPMVTVSDVIVRDVPYYLDEIGRCASSNTVTIMPQVAGRIDAVHFTEGKDVKKGEVLYTIDARPFQAVVEQAKASLEQNKENLKLAKSEFARVEALKGTSAVSQTEYDQKQSAVAVAEAQVEAAQAQLDTANLNLEYCTIKSPIDGRTGMRLVDPGNVVKENETGLVMVQSFEPMYVDFTIAEDRLAEVRKNMANGKLKVFADPAPLPGMVSAATAATEPATQPQPSTQPSNEGLVHEGTLSMIDNAVQPNTGTVRLRATLPNKDRYFWPGQFVHVRLVLHEDKDAVLIPNQALQVGQQGPFVYVVKHDDQKNVDLAEMRPIVQGQPQGDLLVIKQGLNPGDKIIVTGQMMVVPNAPVTIAVPQEPAKVAENRSPSPGTRGEGRGEGSFASGAQDPNPLPPAPERGQEHDFAFHSETHS